MQPRILLILTTIALIAVLAGCGSPAVSRPGPTSVPAATTLARAFELGVSPTATMAGVDLGESAPTAAPDLIESSQATATTLTASPMSTAALSVAAPISADPRVRNDCAPLQASPETNAVSGSGDVTIDVRVDSEPTDQVISPLIYGVATYGRVDAPKLGEHFRDLGVTALRWGGNQVTRHNWEINASNSGSDWYFANVSHGWPDTPPGQAVDDFIRLAQSIGAEPLITIPTMGYVARNGDEATRSGTVPERGGPPLQPSSEAISGYDPSANQRATSIKSFAAKGKPFADPPDLQDEAVYQDEWIDHLTRTFGRAEAKGVKFYALDNEPDLWAHTHRDVHPVEMGYDAMLRMFTEYATAIKAVDPSAQIVAPDLSGPTAFYFSALDRGTDNFRSAKDRAAHGRQPFIEWFLDQLRQHDQRTGRRSLDILSVHNYPQSGVFPGGNDPETNARRLRSTQQLWNPDYTDESWVGRTESAELQLIPRLHQWVSWYYPGTKIAITEWNYGADNTINGGLAIADVLGIFGREGLDLATYWTFPEPGTPGASAFKLYGNYDNCGRHFGDQLLATISTDEPSLSAFGSRDSQSGDILVMTVNKMPNKSVGARFTIDGIDSRAVQVYQFDGEHTAIRRLADVQTDGSSLSYTVPAYAATLFVIKP